MTIGIMQPYIYPYIGYFQLIKAVDKFIIYDDVNYINRGWINRNNILVNGKPYMFTVPLEGASQNKKINEIEIANDKKWKRKTLQTIEQNYTKAPYFNVIFEILQKSIYSTTTKISIFNIIQLKAICNYLNINTEIIPSSSIYNNTHLKGQDRIMDICRQERAKAYINPIGGKELYNSAVFSQQTIELFFMKCKPVIYKQFKEEFVPWLSIIDVMMFNDINEINKLLIQYELK